MNENVDSSVYFVYSVRASPEDTKERKFVTRAFKYHNYLLTDVVEDICKSISTDLSKCMHITFDKKSNVLDKNSRVEIVAVYPISSGYEMVTDIIGSQRFVKFENYQDAMCMIESYVDEIISSQ